MLPLRDTITTRTTPVVTVGIIAANAVAWFYELEQGSHIERFLDRHGLVPQTFFWYMHTHPQRLIGWFEPVLTSMFLHASWMHVLGNMLFLWIFGDNVEDRLGHLRFLVFYLACGAVAALGQVFLVPDSGVPMIGASGAIAGVLGAYFLFYPRARVLTVVPIFFFLQVIEIPAFFFLGFWFLMQFLSGAASMQGAHGGAGVAFGAHVGGFIAGFILGPILARRGQQPARYPTHEVFHPW